MDVHSTNFTLCSFEPGYGFEDDKIFGQTQIKEDMGMRTKSWTPKRGDLWHIQSNKLLQH